MHFLKNIAQAFGSVKSSAQKKEPELSSSTSILQSRLNTSIQERDRFLDNKNIFTNLMEKVEELTTISKKSQFHGIVIFVIFYLAVGQGASILCNSIGCLFPLYASVKAIESQVRGSVTKWLTYWLVFSSVNLMEMFLVWFPAYYLLKFALFVWCMYPAPFNGSQFLYCTFLRPVVLRHQKTVDDVLLLVADSLKNATEKTLQEGMMVEATDSAVRPDGENVAPKTLQATSEKEIKQD